MGQPASPRFRPSVAAGAQVTGVVTALDEAARTVHISLDPWKAEGAPSPPQVPVAPDPSKLSATDAAHLCTAVAAAIARPRSGARLGVWPPEGAGGPPWEAVRAEGLRPSIPPPPPARATSMGPEALADDPGFLNPGGIAAMLQAYRVGGVLSSLHLLEHESAEGYREVRRRQNRLWCTERVARGVEHARAGRAKEALRAYDRAVELDPTFADAYVARGALCAPAPLRPPVPCRVRTPAPRDPPRPPPSSLATRGKYSAAIAQFEKALRFDPGHHNALSYLERTEAKVRPGSAPTTHHTHTHTPPSPPPPPRALVCPRP